MFTGLVSTVGSVRESQAIGGDVRLTVDGPALAGVGLRTGDSVALNGVCLTVVAHVGSAMTFDVSSETLRVTLLGRLCVGDPVNLEPALLPTTRIGGHLVAGHVDGIGRVLWTRESARSRRVRLILPGELARYIARKGSVCVDGVSLTVNEVAGREFEVNVIPHTWENTIFRRYRAGSEVHVEVDLIARYLERLMQPQEDNDDDDKITTKFLLDQGFLGPDEDA